MNIIDKPPFRDFRRLLEALHGWLRERSVRERLMLFVAGTALAAWTFLGVVLTPIDVWRDNQEQNASAWEMRLEWLQTQPRTQARSELRPGVLTSSIGDCGLQLLRVNQEGSGIVVAVQEQSFECLLEWLVQLDADHGIQASQLRLQASPREGGVTGTLRFSPS